MLVRDHIFTVKANKYSVSVPTPGQIIAIEAEKALLSNGLYRDILSSGTMGSAYALDIIDMHAYLSVLAPDVLSDIAKAGTSLLDMDIFDFKELKSEFDKKFTPWVNSWMKMLNAKPEEPKKSVEIRKPQFPEDSGETKKKITVSDLESIPDVTELG